MRVSTELELLRGLSIALKGAWKRRASQAAVSGVRFAGNSTEQEATMHIHTNNNVQLASLGFAREETQAIQAI